MSTDSFEAQLYLTIMPRSPVTAAQREIILPLHTTGTSPRENAEYLARPPSEPTLAATRLSASTVMNPADYAMIRGYHAVIG
ncbi:hypothetical protein RI367_008662 [Sorochytrium milnesiophthora]